MASAKTLLAKLLNDDPQSCSEAASIVMDLRLTRPLVSRIIDVLRTAPHEHQRWEAAYVLWRARDYKEAGEALLAVLQNKEEAPRVRGVAAEQLNNFTETVGRRRLIAAYLAGTYDDSPVVRFWCIYGLASTNATGARRRLQQLAATDHAECPGWSKVSTEAKWALAEFDELPFEARLRPAPLRKPAQLAESSPAAFLARAIELANKNVREHLGGPFGAVIVRGKELIAEGSNRVILYNDPTAHAEMVAIRDACRILQTFDLSGCEIYCSCEPNPMCLGAIYWARLNRIYYAASREDAARAGFNDLHMYSEVTLPIRERSVPTRNMLRSKGRAAFDAWNASSEKIRY